MSAGDDAAAPPIGTHKFGFKSYPEDRYSEWKLLTLNEDGTAKLDVVQEGPGRHSSESTTHEKTLKIGTWLATEGSSKIAIKWEDGTVQTFDEVTKNSR
mmetsp:Transcript_141448/g.368463  ORF Transcript_141448/g.368463 Transcript_141448/m.368463 type:complete len:99 (+) Transcript_141448:68-364(+)